MKRVMFGQKTRNSTPSINDCRQIAVIDHLKSSFSELQPE